MRTKDLERELGLTKHTIHYYEKEGFIYPIRDENGYRNYSDEDLQTLQLVKFLRNLNISIDDVKAIIEGKLDFHECLRVNQVHLENQIESMGELKKAVDKFVERDLPLLPALENIKETSHNFKLGIQKTTDTVSLGRKLTKAWCLRQLLYGFIASLLISFLMGTIFIEFLDLGFYASFMLYIVMIMGFECLFIATAFRSTAPTMLDNSMNQSIEFLNDGIRYYQLKGYWNNLKYFFSVLFGKEEKFVHFCRYEDIEEVEVIANKRFMKISSPIAYEVYVADFVFHFKDGKEFYFFWPMILDDDSKYVAVILKEKVRNIKDKKDILYAFEKGINLNDYLAGI